MNVIKNCPVTLEDVKTAEAIFGSAMLTLKGRLQEGNQNQLNKMKLNY